jgi:hypothetical protein
MAYDLLTAFVIGGGLGALHWAIFGFSDSGSMALRDTEDGHA